MLSKPINPNKENKRKPSQVKTKSNKPKTDNVDGTIRMTYKINSDNLYIRIFGESFAKTNKDKCKMIIGGKEYDKK